MTRPPVANVCALHGAYLEAVCLPCQQGCPPAEDPHTWPAVDLADLQPLWAEATTRDTTTRCDCPSWACIEPGSAGCYFGEAGR